MSSRFSHFVAILLSINSVVWAQPSEQQQQQPKQPNIVVILADDLGYSDLSCYGAEIPTPNIDDLAQQGVRLTQFYNSARCCPSRASLMTGMYQHQVGVGAMIDGYAAWIRKVADRPSYQDHLRPDAPTMPELLRETGYRTMMVGKWHLGDRPNEWPVARGFDRSFALIPGAMNYFGGESDGPRSPLVVDDKKFVPPHDGFFATDAFTDRAIDFLREGRKQKKDQPFFLYMAYNAPHWPLHAKPEDIKKHSGRYDAGWQAIREARLKRMKELGLVDESAEMAPMDRGKVEPWEQLSEADRAEWARRMEIYAAQVTNMDDNIGRLLAELSSQGVAEDTLVIFISDNGGAAEDPHRGPGGEELGTRDTFWGYARPWASVSSTPWRGHKISAYEGGISSPLVARWPAGIPKEAHGTLVRGPSHLIDLLPSFLEVAGKTYPTSDANRLEGRSIVSMFKGKDGSNDRTLFWEHEGNRAVRKGKWKLVSLPNQEWELYDIEADRIESNNLVAKRPKVVKDLKAEYERWAERASVVPWSEVEPHRPPKR